MNSELDKPQAHIGRITDIQRFSLHDGPGIRTTVFLKGCNLHCAWCHNPETISRDVQLVLDPDKCIHCGKCEEGCFSGARKQVGRDITAREVMEEVLLDKSYYGNDGGVTVSGGEPTLQADFTKAILNLARSEKIGTAIETNLLAPEDVLIDIARCCDLIMCDLKIFDSEEHKKYTGAGNEVIFRNLLAIDHLDIPIIVRTPVITGVNDNKQCISSIARFLLKMNNIQLYELLPYHRLGLSKTVEGMPEQMIFETPKEETMLELAGNAKEYFGRIAIKGERI